MIPDATKDRGRTPMVAGNWKMNTTVDAGIDLARAVCAATAESQGVEIAMLPPFTHLWAVRPIIAGSGVLLGAQDVFWEASGAYTGEISPSMLAGVCDLVLVGHSERRHLFGERDEEVGRKFAAALAVGLRVILAVGETSKERDADETFAVVDRQLDAVFGMLAEPAGSDRFVIAYEPVWAIGTGRTATPEQAQEVTAHIKAHLARAPGEPAPLVLYGGSVTATNAVSLFAQQDIDGALVGGASLRADEFAAIVAAAAGSAGERR
ncbi:MAG: triose-phosphate isomerase [Candidatus Dormiibacterota bacterium]